MAKISQSNIADELAAKSDITHDAADSFIHSLIDTIKKGVQEDNIVKIKGLGTFKLQEVSDRESVDVNTGERITIKGYRKVTFTPDSTMKEFVNRPFAHFEPTELNDGYPTEEESSDTTNVADKSEDIEIAEETVTEREAIEEEEVTNVTEQTTEMSETTETTETTDTDKAPKQVQEQQSEEETAAEPIANSTSANAKKEDSKRRSYGWSFVLLLLMIAVGTYYWHTTQLAVEEQSQQEAIEEVCEMTVNPYLEEELGAALGDTSKPHTPQPTEVKKNQSSSEAKSTVPKETAPPKTEPTQKAEIVVHKATTEVNAYTVPLTEGVSSKELKDITIADTTDYTIAGTLTTHKLRNGETLILLAKRYYGDKRLWPYIVEHNRIKDFNKVAIGQTIEIPILKEKQSNP